VSSCCKTNTIPTLTPWSCPRNPAHAVHRAGDGLRQQQVTGTRASARHVRGGTGGAAHAAPLSITAPSDKFVLYAAKSIPLQQTAHITKSSLTVAWKRPSREDWRMLAWPIASVNAPLMSRLGIRHLIQPRMLITQFVNELAQFAAKVFDAVALSRRSRFLFLAERLHDPRGQHAGHGTDEADATDHHQACRHNSAHCRHGRHVAVSDCCHGCERPPHRLTEAHDGGMCGMVFNLQRASDAALSVIRPGVSGVLLFDPPRRVGGFCYLSASSV